MMSQPLTAITLFAGAGGWDTGFVACGVAILAALNHNARSLATHRLNFPWTRQVLTDLTKDHPKDYPHATFLQASPECRYHTDALGRKRPGHRMRSLWPELADGWSDGEEDDPAERSRATMNEVLKWAEVKKAQSHPFRLIFVENVPEVNHWSGYASWWAEMQRLGYHGQTLCFNSMFAPAFPAPCYESRDRWYAVFSLQGEPIPDLDIRPRAHCRACGQQDGARQCWKSQKRWGAYGEQYVYGCVHCGREVVPGYRPARGVLDLTLPTPPIGGRQRSLVPKTLEKIRVGVERYRATDSAFLLSYYSHAGYRTLDDPIGTITTKPRHALITIPYPRASLEECGYRMLCFEESRRAMGYPPAFRFACGPTEALRQIGLSVTPAVAAMLVQRGIAALGEGVTA